MKKSIVLLMIVTMLSTLSTASYGISADYEGLSTAKELYENIDFVDIKNHWAKDSIYKMASLSIIKGMGASKFAPDNTLTKEQSLALLVRLMGLEKEAQESGEKLAPNTDTGTHTISNPSDYWMEGYIDIATKNNIVSKEEIAEIINISEDEQYDIDLEIDREIVPYESDVSLTEIQIANIEKQLRDKMKKKYTWKEPVEREQIAIWVARVLNLEPISGTNQQLIYNLKDWEKISIENIPIIESILQNNIMQGNDKGYFNPKSSLTRGEMAKMLDNIHEDVLLERGFKINTGIVERIDSIYQSEDDINIKQRTYNIENDDNTLTTIQSQESSDNTLDKGFIVYDEGELALPEDINEYNYIKYYIDPENDVVFIEKLNNKSFTIEAFVEEIDEGENYITIKTYEDETAEFNVSPAADIRINNQVAKLKDLLYGQGITLIISNGNVTDIDGYLDTGEEGYIHPGERIDVGKVLYIDNNNGKLTLIDDEDQREFDVDPFIPVIKNDVNVGLSSIKEGDMVRLEFDEYDGNTPMKIYVANKDKQIENLIKATVTRFNPNRNEVILKDVSNFNQNKWEESQDKILPLGNDTEIYMNGRKIAKELLPSYTGREAYIVTKDNFNKEEILRVVLKSGYEKKYDNSIQDIAFGDKRIEVDYNNVYFDDSTIIVKEGKLIHPYNLKEDDDILMVAQGKDAYTATFISVENIPDIDFTIYRGRIDEILDYGFELDDFDILEGTEWSFTTKQTGFSISEDTKIIDTRDENIEKVSVENFNKNRFSNDYKAEYYREHAYAVEYGDMIIAMNIIDGEDEGRVITVSNVKEIDKTNNTITLEDTKDWSEFKEKWEINSSQTSLEVNDAIFIKNGKAINIKDISINDSLYVLRKNNVGYIIVVR